MTKVSKENQNRKGRGMTNKGKKEYLTMVPYVAVALYMGGLFLLVLGQMGLGVACIIVGTVMGVTAGIIRFKKRYKPSRQTYPKWMQIFGMKDRV